MGDAVGKRRGVPTPQEILERLTKVAYPGFTRDIVSFGMVKDIEVSSSAITVHLAPSTAQQDVLVQILPKLGLPTPGERIDFGTVQATKGATAPLSITGPGCAWWPATRVSNSPRVPERPPTAC